MKKSVIRIIAIAAVLVTMAVDPLNAQIFLQKDRGDISPRATANGTTGKEWVIVPVQGLDIDQYAFTPTGSGALLLAGLAGAYGFAKRRKKDENKK